MRSLSHRLGPPETPSSTCPLDHSTLSQSLETPHQFSRDVPSKVCHTWPLQPQLSSPHSLISTAQILDPSSSVGSSILPIHLVSSLGFAVVLCTFDSAKPLVFKDFPRKQFHTTQRFSHGERGSRWPVSRFWHWSMDLMSFSQRSSMLVVSWLLTLVFRYSCASTLFIELCIGVRDGLFLANWLIFIRVLTSLSRMRFLRLMPILGRRSWRDSLPRFNLWMINLLHWIGFRSYFRRKNEYHMNHDFACKRPQVNGTRLER